MAARLAALAALAIPASARPTPEELYGHADASSLPRYRKSVSFDANEPLRQAAQRAGIFIGSAINVADYTNTSDPAYAATFVEQFNLATAENECKTAHTEPQQGNFTLSDCVFLLNATLNAGGQMRGHNTAWGVYNPAWLVAMNNTATPAQLQAALTRHIDGTIGAIHGPQWWDVVNEPFSDGGVAAPIFKTATPWYPALHDYVSIALRAARAAAPPGTLLFVNEYGAEGASLPKAQRVYETVKAFRAAGVPIDGIGLQMHVSTGGFPQPSDVAANIAQLGALGLKVHITEMDVACGPPCDEDAQAAIYGGMLDACLNNTGVCQSFETWGFTDRYTWLWDWDNPNHVNKAPLPFDINYQPKAAVAEMLAVFAVHEERRRAQAAAAVAR